MKLVARLKHFETFPFLTFKCSDFFVGNELAKHNRKWLVKAKASNQRKIRFIKEILKEVDTKYYTDYIGTLSDQDKKRLTRNNKIDKILL